MSTADVSERKERNWLRFALAIICSQLIYFAVLLFGILLTTKLVSAYGHNPSPSTKQILGAIWYVVGAFAACLLVHLAHSIFRYGR